METPPGRKGVFTASLRMARCMHGCQQMRSEPVDWVLLEQLPEAVTAQQATTIALLQEVIGAPQWEPMSWRLIAAQNLGGCAWEAYYTLTPISTCL